jgi:2-polyprenyl-6-methoxyphenol hydroxylase-like FAD-dependent oxidoreductase
MSNPMYDIISVGGGLGGSAIAKSMAEAGARVLVLERERRFQDRVRGEGLSPWGGAEAARLGLNDALEAAHANQGRFACGLGPPRDLAATTPQGLPNLNFYHPAMQEAVLAAAVRSGAEIVRGASVTSVAPGFPAKVEYTNEGKAVTAHARLVIGADGRTSNVRKWGDFTPRRDPERLIIAGVLLEGGEEYRDDTIYLMLNPDLLRGVFLITQGDRRFRAYLVYRSDDDLQMHGVQALPRFIAGSIECKVPADFYANTKPAGPLASFQAADSWVDHPYSSGVVLIGDAAAASDPTWGQGLSLTLRDVRVLRDFLLADENWDLAAGAYADEHDRYYGALHTWENWYTCFFFDRSEQADARRAKAMPLIMEDPSRVPDHLFCGPELPIDDSVRRRFFAEE